MLRLNSWSANSVLYLPSLGMNLTSPSLPGTYSSLHLVVDADGDEPKGDQTAV